MGFFDILKREKSASVPIPAREIAPTPPECFLPYISDALKIGPITYKNTRFHYRVTSPEGENLFWENFLSELDKMGDLEETKKRVSNKIYKLIYIKDIVDRGCPDDVDLWHMTMIEIYADKESDGFRFFLIEQYPDPWDAFFIQERGGEITFEEFLSCMRRMGRAH